MEQKIIRVRFAPSPTGNLHIGGVRTALFNWLFAKKQNGDFILRIEDTDRCRSTQVYADNILDTLKWLKLTWNHGPFYQIQRTKLYSQYVNELLKRNHAYKCYCTVDDIAKAKYTSKQNKIPFKYNCKCKYLTLAQINKKTNNPVIRFIVPKTGTTIFNDLIKGTITFDNSLLSDFIIMRSDNLPTYNLACVIDDYTMNITHVIRGDDHISNTPRQILIYNALRWSIPHFAHISMILNIDRQRLSKRYDSISVLKYRKEGYLQEALVNYLALLGWSTIDSQQIFTVQELQQKFTIEKCSSNPAIFDHNKLLWLNKEKIRSKSVDEIYDLFVDWANNDMKLNNLIANWNIKTLKKIIKLEHNKLTTLNDIIILGNMFFNYNLVYNKKINEILFDTNTKIVLNESVKRLSSQKDFSATALELYARDLAREYQLTTPKVFHPIRIAISGNMRGPSLFSMMEILGQYEIIKRMSLTLDKINKIQKGEKAKCQE
ncbi:MAG: glutamate--tRNA ligase [Endomicrobium sp.]|jgi:glutamyl-tRNA synthetase|nr:glutamate--tRNA ligase [Endomicrobium sp.]